MRNIEHNMDSAVPGWRDRWAFAAVGVVVLLAIAASLQFATWLDGPGSPEARRLDTGWFYLRDGVSEPIDSLPCTLDVEGESLVLCRDLTEEEKLHSRYVLTIRSRYASVRVWADDALIYEAAQGREHALGSMWHFIPMSSCAQADRLTVEECENDAYLLAWESIPPHQPWDYLFAFLGRIMRHAVLNACAARRCRKRAAALTELTAEMEQCIPSPSDTAGEVDGILLGEAVSAFLRTIPEEQRIMFLRRYWYFDSVGDIARRCMASESKVKSVLFRVRKHLKDYLIKEGYHL